MRSDDVTLALIEMRQASARERGLDTLARQTRRAARRSRARRWWLGPARPGDLGVRVWIRTSWHALSGHRERDRPRR